MTKYSPRDLLLARRAKRAGANYSLRIILEARRAGFGTKELPLSLAFGVVDWESNGFRNIFGCDRGSILCHKPVTHERVLQLLNHIKMGGTSNGVGLTQLTWPGYIRQAEALGGAHKPIYQLRVGFNVLAANIHQHGVVKGLAAYNAGDPNSGQGKLYARKVLGRANHWHSVLVP